MGDVNLVQMPLTLDNEGSLKNLSLDSGVRDFSDSLLPWLYLGQILGHLDAVTKCPKTVQQKLAILGCDWPWSSNLLLVCDGSLEHCHLFYAMPKLLGGCGTVKGWVACPNNRVC